MLSSDVYQTPTLGEKKSQNVSNVTICCEMSAISVDHTNLFGQTLSTTQQIWIGLLIPTVCNCALYAVDIGTSIALAWRHFEEKNYVWASFTLIFIYLPSLVFFVHIVSKPHLWEQHTRKTKSVLWFSLRILQIVAFPAWIIYRYTKQLFWSLEALFRDGEEQREAMEMAGKPSLTYLYLFLQAFLQSAPQAFLQLYILLRQYDNHIETDYMHVTCIFTSLLNLSITVASFQLFESQKVLGRKKPWSVKHWLDSRGKYAVVQIDEHKQKENNINTELKINDSEESCKETSNNYTNTQDIQPAVNNEVQNDLSTNVKEEQVSPLQQPRTDPEFSDSEPSTPYLQPKLLPPIWERVLEMRDRGQQDGNTDNQNNSSPIEDEQLHHSCTQEAQTDLNLNLHSSYLTPPIEDAPSPPLENNQNLILHSREMSSHESVNLQFRSRIPSLTSDEKLQKTGSKLDDSVGLCISVLYWFLFLLSRMIAIASFSQLYPLLAFGLCALQYVITVSILLFRNRSHLEKAFAQLGLGYVYLFCLIEFKIRFRKWLISYVAYFSTMNLEDIIITAIWYVSVELKGWWETYVLIIMAVSMGLSSVTFAYYSLICKPQIVKLYLLN